ncbi:MAG: 16S rRNA (uracil(1498)-N(3))-methyltransferase [Thermoanaerobaculia bacterium]
MAGRRFRHVQNVHRARLGDELAVGRVGGRVGTGVVESIAHDSIEFSVRLEAEPPPKLALTVILALPRPKVLARVLGDLTSLGVPRIVLLNSWRVEKSYWSSPILEEGSLLEIRRLGLEQARDTILPEIRVERFFQPFLHGGLAAFAPAGPRYVAHPGSAISAPRDVSEPSVVAIGPEGGWVERELESFEREGFQAITLGSRPLRVETAVTALISRMF